MGMLNLSPSRGFLVVGFRVATRSFSGMFPRLFYANFVQKCIALQCFASVLANVAPLVDLSLKASALLLEFIRGGFVVFVDVLCVLLIH